MTGPPSPSAAPRATTHAGWLLPALAVLCWAGNFVAGRALRNEVPAVALTFWRWALAFVILLPFTWADIRGQWPAVRRAWKVLTLLALFAAVLQHIPVYWGLRETTATNGALLNATSPIFILLLSVVMLKERLRPIAVVGMLVSFAGVVVIVSRGDFGVFRTLELNSGDAWILGSSVAWGFYTVMLRFRPAEFSGLPLVTLIAGFASAMLLPLWIVEIAVGRPFAPSLPAIGGILYVGLFASVIAYVAWNRGVALIGPARTAPFMYLMLVFTPLLSIAFLGESVHLYHFAGGALILSGIWLASLGRRA